MRKRVSLGVLVLTTCAAVTTASAQEAGTFPTVDGLGTMFASGQWTIVRANGSGNISCLATLVGDNVEGYEIELLDGSRVGYRSFVVGTVEHHISYRTGPIVVMDGYDEVSLNWRQTSDGSSRSQGTNISAAGSLEAALADWRDGPDFPDSGRVPTHPDAPMDVAIGHLWDVKPCMPPRADLNAWFPAAGWDLPFDGLLADNPLVACVATFGRQADAFRAYHVEFRDRGWSGQLFIERDGVPEIITYDMQTEGSRMRWAVSWEPENGGGRSGGGSAANNLLNTITSLANRSFGAAVGGETTAADIYSRIESGLVHPTDAVLRFAMDFDPECRRPAG